MENTVIYPNIPFIQKKKRGYDLNVQSMEAKRALNFSMAVQWLKSMRTGRALFSKPFEPTT